MTMNLSKKKAVYFTRFEYLPSAGGGCRRFVQTVDDLRQRYEVEVKSTRDPADFAEANNSTAKAISSIGWDASYHACERYLLMGEYWAKHEDLTRFDMIIVDDPVYFPELVYRAKSLGIPLVGVCHNIETLAEGQVSSDLVVQSLKVELGILQNLDCVITVSQEENFLLRNVGINSFYYPYYPCEFVEARLKKIRQRRTQLHGDGQATNNKQILFFGSLGNIPTRIGLERLLEEWPQQQLFQKTGYELLVTGFGSERFLDRQNDSAGIKILGPLDDEAFDTQLASASAAIIYQGKGAGALTRISESLVAGMNVLANQHAARSYRNLEGVVEFSDDFSGLTAALNQLQQRSGRRVISRSKPDVGQLLSTIERAIIPPSIPLRVFKNAESEPNSLEKAA